MKNYLLLFAIISSVLIFSNIICAQSETLLKNNKDILADSTSSEGTVQVNGTGELIPNARVIYENDSTLARDTAITDTLGYYLLTGLEISIGIDEIETKENQIIITNNPGVDHNFILPKDVEQAYIINNFGQVIEQLIVQNDINESYTYWNGANFAEGQYIFVAKTSQGSITKKIIQQNGFPTGKLRTSMENISFNFKTKALKELKGANTYTITIESTDSCDFDIKPYSENQTLTTDANSFVHNVDTTDTLIINPIYANIGGNVNNPIGSGAYAIVEMWSVSDSTELFIDTTNSSGGFAFWNVELNSDPDTFAFRFTCENPGVAGNQFLETLDTIYNINEGNNGPINFYMNMIPQHRDITYHITENRSGANLDGVTFKLRNPADSTTIYTGVSDANGNLTLSDVALGNIYLLGYGDKAGYKAMDYIPIDLTAEINYFANDTIETDTIPTSLPLIYDFIKDDGFDTRKDTLDAIDYKEMAQSLNGPLAVNDTIKLYDNMGLNATQQITFDQNFYTMDTTFNGVNPSFYEWVSTAGEADWEIIAGPPTTWHQWGLLPDGQIGIVGGTVETNSAQDAIIKELAGRIMGFSATTRPGFMNTSYSPPTDIDILIHTTKKIDEKNIYQNGTNTYHYSFNLEDNLDSR